MRPDNQFGNFRFPNRNVRYPQVLLFGVGLTLAAASSPAHAGDYILTFQGNLITVYSRAGLQPFDNTVTVGTPFTYTFTWDTNLPSTVTNAGIYDSRESQVTGAEHGATVTFGDYGFHSDGSSIDILVKSVAHSPGIYDQIAHNTLGGTTTGAFSSLNSSGVPGASVAFYSVYPDKSPFPNTDFHPAQDWNPALFDSHMFYFALDGYNGGLYDVTGKVTQTTFTAATVPEPSPLASFGLPALGLVGLLLHARRKKALPSA